MNVAEYNKLISKDVNHKYGAKKTVVDGFKFDSQAEANYYAELKIRQRAGEIQSFELQPIYELIPKAKGERAVKYVADFLITHNDGRQEVVDVKGVRTAVYKLKKRIFEDKYNMKITEVEA